MVFVLSMWPHALYCVESVHFSADHSPSLKNTRQASFGSATGGNIFSVPGLVQPASPLADPTEEMSEPTDGTNDPGPSVQLPIPLPGPRSERSTMLVKEMVASC